MPETTVGIVGGGQLARMLNEAACALDIDTILLIENSTEPGARGAKDVILGTPFDETAVKELTQKSTVLTFDHELVDLELLRELEAKGVRMAPSPKTLLYAVDKAHMREHFLAAGLPIPNFCISETTDEIQAFGDKYSWPLIAKTPRGGYDGKGVQLVTTPLAGRFLYEEKIDIDYELSVMVARAKGGEMSAWPAVETVQKDGICHEVLFPGSVTTEVAQLAREIALQIAETITLVGVMAVEMFSIKGDVLINEIACRPHNSGHWSIEGAITSQFEAHLRAILSLPIGALSPMSDEIASVNILGGSAPPENGLFEALAVPGAHIHLYGKAWRPGRKLGHVTCLGKAARQRAWEAARALGVQ